MTDKDLRRFVFALLVFSPFLAPLGAADLPSGPLDAPSAPPSESPRAPLRASFSMDVASAYFFDSGYVVDDGPVVQPAFGVSDGRAFLPLKFAFWGNYALEREAPPAVLQRLGLAGAVGPRDRLLRRLLAQTL